MVRGTQRTGAPDDARGGGIGLFTWALLRAATRGTCGGGRVAFAFTGTQAVAAGGIVVNVRIRPAGNGDEPEDQEQAGSYSAKLGTVAHTISVDSPNGAQG